MCDTSNEVPCRMPATHRICKPKSSELYTQVASAAPRASQAPLATTMHKWQRCTQATLPQPPAPMQNQMQPLLRQLIPGGCACAQPRSRHPPRPAAARPSWRRVASGEAAWPRPAQRVGPWHLAPFAGALRGYSESGPPRRVCRPPATSGCLRARRPPHLRWHKHAQLLSRLHSMT